VPELLGGLPELFRQLPESFRHAENLQKPLILPKNRRKMPRYRLGENYCSNGTIVNSPAF
jgi:hypothetical protein